MVRWHGFRSQEARTVIPRSPRPRRCRAGIAAEAAGPRRAVSGGRRWKRDAQFWGLSRFHRHGNEMETKPEKWKRSALFGNEMETGVLVSIVAP